MPWAWVLRLGQWLGGRLLARCNVDLIPQMSWVPGGESQRTRLRLGSRSSGGPELLASADLNEKQSLWMESSRPSNCLTFAGLLGSVVLGV